MKSIARPGPLKVSRIGYRCNPIPALIAFFRAVGLRLAHPAHRRIELVGFDESLSNLGLLRIHSTREQL